ncbi:MAG: gliding motility lipoprotein GldD [Flavobacteriales bacterium]|nr:MAG: gliding motility lipoprotein GldD [Flavobacteriales bacterium]
MKNKLFSFIAISIFLISCGNDTFTPKPKGYFRIDLPKKEYHPLIKDCPFVFEIPNYTSTIPNINNPNKLCWFDIVFNNLNASIYMSYKPVEKNLREYLEDSRSLAFKHTVKAHNIEQQIISFPDKKVYGLIYSIEGNAASAYQFHLTDSTNHFIRGSLYFNNIPNQDSIQPVLSFIKEDIEHIFETFEWK